jgi:glycosyltransferase involved in cell wall biosynthesis
MTRAEQQRYRELGLETPYVPWGCHPELIDVANSVDRGGRDDVTFVFTGGFLGRRKPLEPVLEAWALVKSRRARLVVKAQVERSRLAAAESAAADDGRIELRISDEPTRVHLETVAAADVTLSPARWEGLGLPLYEAVAFGQPAITNDVAPMNEITRDGENGLLVASVPDGTARSGIPAHSFDPAAMAAAIDRLAEDDDLRADLSAGAAALREGERAWPNTVRGFGSLLEMAAA